MHSGNLGKEFWFEESDEEVNEENGNNYTHDHI